MTDNNNPSPEMVEMTRRAAELWEQRDHARWMAAGWKRLAKRMRDDPEMDATDAAHPAWWRGHHHGAEAMKGLVERLQAQRKLAAAHNANVIGALQSECDLANDMARRLETENEILKARIAELETRK